ncbi:penicillin acylase family protein [Streptomyces sp. ADMS]|uniref:penicillin acylase family protein n=1 Tax=Streptomyces sp. ADMS TaxID=3071415 RepID=UPI00296FA5E9|nr:penicillin acylase family protein [Streptomyces sp. ADMS]MDW4908659.1 penicillin acylase family protein [Streptomyces sp. ADMS]
MPSRSRTYRDAWGIPHLRAADPLQLAHGQGRNAACDRAWQIEVERHRSQGTAAAILGAPALSWDLLARRARLDDTARRCFDALDPATAAWVTAYVDGVNAGLEQGAAAAPEFPATGLTPTPWRPWTPLGVWLAHHILFAGFPTKLWREEVARRLGIHALGLFATDGPGTAGSNGWLVPGHRTAHGAPIIAGDPHRPLQNPGFYQQLHLSCPEFDVVGFAVPGVPGIAHFGHAGTVAWAITNAMADYHDLYEEKLRGTDDGRVEALGPDGWRPVLHRRRETVEVAGGDPVDVDVIETARGPVIIGDTGNLTGPSGAEATVISLRYPPRVTADLGFAAIPALLHARTVADVDRAFDRWIEPVNVVHAADTEGGLLHRVAGYVPVRHRDNTLRVVPARQPGHDWRGRHDTPRAEVDDLAVMANARGLATPLGTEFAPPHRADRITELLRRSHEWTAPEMGAVHMDAQLPFTAPLLEQVARLVPRTPAAACLRESLLAWDRRMDAGSTVAADYARLRSAVVRRIAKAPQLRSLAGPLPYPAVFEPWLNLTGKVAFALDNLLTTDLLPGLDLSGILVGALEETAGADPVTWGELHRLAPLRVLPGGEEQWPGLGGDHDCVLATSSVPGITDVSSRGPSARYVWDLADRDSSLWIVPLGANGIPGNAHHRDQLPLWTSGRLAPVVTDFAHLTEETGTEEEGAGGGDGTQGRISNWKSKA